ncbi:MAG TPA: DUF5916 domain-containing protein [Gemmatimonadaceae bacterium]|jgi:hypothetical protein|nr:DUF5916 domain-containing protein [Gemmatimonadaceae bacterium]
MPSCRPLTAAARVALLTVPFALTPAASAQTPNRSAVGVRAERAPVLDGRDDDAVWRAAPRISDFRQFSPRIDTAASLRTEFRVAYDERNLFVFVRMFDPHPDSILHALTRRDVRGPSDQIKILVDSYDDKRSGFEFAVNPDGVKRDYSMSNDGNEDSAWNGIWDVATRVDSLGWTAEFRIPLSQLRYARGENNTFGFGVWRDIERYNERDAWPVYSPNKAGLVSQLGRLTGLTGIASDQRIEATPYVVTKNVERATARSPYARNQQVTVGGDLKLGLTPNVTLDATINPDFGQVEADPAVVNLTAFETYFAEQRPFFVEGTGLYRFQLNCYIVVDCSTNEGLFYSRRIGRSPALRDLYGDASTATATPIAMASKLTGRTASGLSFGLLDAVTERVRGPINTVEPLSNYAVLRAQQDLRGGEAGFSIIATAVNRSLDTVTSPYMHRDAYTSGATFRNRFGGGRYELAGQFAGSYVAGSKQALLATQQSSAHYFQQPNDKLTLDSNRTSLSGYAAQLKFGKYGGGVTRFESSLIRQSAGFEVNDLGYLRRADVVDWSTWGALTFQSARGIYRWMQINGNHWETWNTSGTRLENALNVNGHMGFMNNWDAHLGGTVGKLTPSYCDRCTRGGPVLRQSRSFSPWGGINTDSRQTISTGVWVNLWFNDGGKSQGASFSPYVNVHPSSSLQLSFGPGVTHDHNNTQWFGNFTDGATGTTHYTFAHLDQRTVSISTRVTYTMTPNLTFEFYGQPFVSTGEYSDARELSSTPRAASYDDRFKPYAVDTSTAMTFKAAQLRTNSVVRWEYRPGSTLFLVWAHGRNGPANSNMNQSWSQDYRDLFSLHPVNTFLVKLAYWMNR